jgi:hypothetical protein
LFGLIVVSRSQAFVVLLLHVVHFLTKFKQGELVAEDSKTATCRPLRAAIPETAALATSISLVENLMLNKIDFRNTRAKRLEGVPRPPLGFFLQTSLQDKVICKKCDNFHAYLIQRKTLWLMGILMP